MERLVHDIKQRQKVDQQKIIVVADNRRFHRTNIVRSFFKIEKIMWLFIPPYSPEINHCEKFINIIKEYMKSQASQQKYEKFYHRFRIIYFKTIENAIYSVERKHWIGFVRKSIEETLHLLKKEESTQIKWLWIFTHKHFNYKVNKIVWMQLNRENK